jgi:VWFA-related protein
VRALSLFAWIVFPAVLLVAAQQGSDEESFTIAVDVDLVMFQATVTDDRGRHVSGLEAGDFRIHEDGRLQEIRLFDAADALASVGLIIDNSGSMIDKRAQVIDAALAFTEASNPGDEMFVLHFNEYLYQGFAPPFTSDLEVIRSALVRPTPAGLTALYDALAYGIGQLKAGSRDRKALVVLSDGGDNASRLSMDDLLQQVRQSSATIYPIGIYDETNVDRNEGVLRQIAEISGGRAFFPRSVNNLESVWLDIVGGIRNQYTLGYHSSNLERDGAFRRVTITANRSGGRDLRVIAREGYMAPTDDR